jgi:hypothetical protein
VKTNPKAKTIEKKDMSKECGIDLTICNGGVQCYGETKHCNKCFCRVCVRAKCIPSLKVR